jgi:ABC-2 type transport system ATP-binding protein
MPGYAVVVDDVAVSYGTTRALGGVELRVPHGTTLGVLGPNGAGKTTLIRVLTTLIRPDRGRVRIDGIDALAQPGEVRRRIGVTGQYAGLDEFLTTFENLELVGRLAGLRTAARGRAHDLVDRFELQAIASRRVGELSGGTRRRVDLAASLVGSPTVLFLDEPTTGLDPAARQALWDVVAELTAAGTTVLLTTQYLEEADRLADQVVILDHGRIAGQGTPADLKSRVGGKVVRAIIPAGGVDQLAARPDLTTPLGADRVEVSFALPDAASAAAMVGRLATGTVTITEIDVTAPSLDDVFFHLASTGAPT